MDYATIEFLVSRLPLYRTRSNGIEFQKNYPESYVYERSRVDVGLNPYDPYEAHMEGDFIASRNDKVFVTVELKKYPSFREARNRFLERCQLCADDAIPLGIEKGIRIGDIASGDNMFLDFIRANIFIRVEAVHAEGSDEYSILAMARELDVQVLASMGLTEETVASGHAKLPDTDIRNVVPGSGGFAVRIDGQSITITGYYGTMSQIAVPRRINALPVTVIGEWAFYEKGLRTVKLPAKLAVIGDWAFMCNYLRNMEIPKSVSIIGAMAFYNNYLTDLVIPDSVTVIGKEAFCGNKLSRVTISSRITRIESGTFAENNLAVLDLPESVTVIGESAFARNRLNKATIPNGVVSIGDNAFKDNALTVITMPGDVQLPEDSGHPAFEGGFDEYYTLNGKQPGVYRLDNRGWGKVQ
ncbi:MAG: leucine-rich repeat domain-containing protein [Spirochaetaceae bacterium]|nr:leucine-rich repeat domain-containing protein [Spirochaetaceae bacterium]